MPVAAALADDVAYFVGGHYSPCYGTRRDHLSAVDSSTGHMCWQHESDPEEITSVVVGHAVLYLGLNNSVCALH
jgi:outer membrane protein assembly factor BamB